MDENRERGGRDFQQIDDISSTGERDRRVSSDTLLSAVADGHRRAIINSLTNASDKTLTRDELVDRVADRVGDEGAERASDEHRQRIRIELHHSHLPKLQELRIIDYETETGPVTFVGGELEQDILTLVEPYDVDE